MKKFKLLFMCAFLSAGIMGNLDASGKRNSSKTNELYTNEAPADDEEDSGDVDEEFDDADEESEALDNVLEADGGLSYNEAYDFLKKHIKNLLEAEGIDVILDENTERKIKKDLETLIKRKKRLWIENLETGKVTDKPAKQNVGALRGVFKYYVEYEKHLQKNKKDYVVSYEGIIRIDGVSNGKGNQDGAGITVQFFKGITEKSKDETGTTTSVVQIQKYNRLRTGEVNKRAKALIADLCNNSALLKQIVVQKAKDHKGKNYEKIHKMLCNILKNHNYLNAYLPENAYYEKVEKDERGRLKDDNIVTKTRLLFRKNKDWRTVELVFTDDEVDSKRGKGMKYLYLNFRSWPYQQSGNSIPGVRMQKGFNKFFGKVSVNVWNLYIRLIKNGDNYKKAWW